MRNVTLSLAAVMGLGVLLFSGRSLAANRATLGRHARSAVAANAATAATAATANRLWYGGILAPIVVEAVAPAKGSTHAASRGSSPGR